jgi:hypothetical protein
MKCYLWSYNVFELSSFYSLVFQPGYVSGSLNCDHDSPPANMLNSGVQSPPRSPCRCAEHLSRISDLEGRLALLKRQAKSTLDKAGKSYSFDAGRITTQLGTPKGRYDEHSSKPFPQ